MFRTGDCGLFQDGAIVLGAPVTFGRNTGPTSGLSQVELQKITSAVACVVGSHSVATVELDCDPRRLHCFIDKRLTKNDDSVPEGIREGINDHMKLLQKNGDISMWAVVEDVHSLHVMPVAQSGKLDQTRLQARAMGLSLPSPLSLLSDVMSSSMVSKPRSPTPDLVFPQNQLRKHRGLVNALRCKSSNLLLSFRRK